MSNHHDSKQANRVLGRLGARELTPQEVARVSQAGVVHTNVITFNPVTFQIDGDG
jgi:hypothetical protein